MTHDSDLNFIAYTSIYSSNNISKFQVNYLKFENFIEQCLHKKIENKK